MSATPASMLQVVTSGLQDRERLNSPVGSPSVQFYKSVMRRRTRWASQWRRVEFDNLADFGRTAVVTLPIIGELITRATLVVNLPDIYTPQLTARDYTANIIGPSWAWTNSIGHAICSDVQMLIGDQVIDQFDSRSLEVMDELTTPIEHYDSANELIGRNPSSFSDQELLNITQNKPSAQSPNQTVEVVFPFWWNRGPGPQALPIQALWKDKVQIKVTFRPVQQCVYTSSRIDPRNPPLSANQGAGPMPNITGCGFFVSDPSGTPIYNAAATAQLPSNPFNGRVSTVDTMPTSYHFKDAYWIVEYISLEDREAAAYRMADLEIPIEQHVALPVVETGGAEHVRIRLEKGGLVRDLTWIAQRVEAPDYNAYFLFSKDLGPAAGPPLLVDSNGSHLEPVPVQNPCDIPWWPNAVVPDWDYGNGYIRPAFADRNSDPILAAKMLIRGLTRFDHESSSMFRSVLPLQNCKRVPLVNRYIYRYDFGFWSTGGLAEANERPVDEIRGYSNWDKLPSRELSLYMNTTTFHDQQWVLDGSGIQFKEGSIPPVSKLRIPQTTDGLLVILTGAHPVEDVSGSTFNGNGAVVAGIVDYRSLILQSDFLGLFARVIANGSASLVVKRSTTEYEWLAVAGGGGWGNKGAGEFYFNSFPSVIKPLLQFGGTAGTAEDIGWQGGNNAQTHTDIDKTINIAYTNSNSDSTGSIMDPLTTITYDMNSTVLSKKFIMLFNTSITNFQFVMNNINTPVRVDLLSDDSSGNTVVIKDTSGNPCSYRIQRQNSLSTHIAYMFTTDPNPPPNTMYNTYVGIRTIFIAVGKRIQIRIRAETIAKIFSYEVALHEGTLSCNINTTYRTTPNVDESPNTVWFGGGGGGTISTNEPAGIGKLDGKVMTTDAVFVQSTVLSDQSTGGSTFAARGGDGYYGGGSGLYGGGGGGSYVSDLITNVNTFEQVSKLPASAKIYPLRRIPVTPPKFVIYSWLTRYNRLRIHSGRGALMFNEAT